jgi:hypothetical protein
LFSLTGSCGRCAQGVINVSDLLTLLANSGSTCDATGSGAGRELNTCIPKNVDGRDMICCWDRHVARGGDTDEAWSTRLYEAMICDPDTGDGPASIAPMLSGIDNIGKDVADQLCTAVCGSGPVPLCACDDTVRCDAPEDIETITVSGAGSPAWNGVYRKGISAEHPADGFVWILNDESNELYKKALGAQEPRWRLSNWQRSGVRTLEVENYIALR